MIITQVHYSKTVKDFPAKFAMVSPQSKSATETDVHRSHVSTHHYLSRVNRVQWGTREVLAQERLR